MKATALLAVVVFLFGTISCSTHQAHLKYTDFQDMPVRAGAVGGKALGTVSGEDGGAIWDNCTEKARGSVLELIAEARKKGGNAVGNLKWDATGTSDSGCKKSWGYFALWPFVLTPFFMSTRVEGTAYKTDGSKSSSLYMLPNSKEEEQKLVAQLLESK
jgi:hypothetical protein